MGSVDPKELLVHNMKAFIFLVLVAAVYAEPTAEAEANADAGYYGYYGYPYAYGLVGKSAPCVNHANVPVPCAGRKKREADPNYYAVGHWPYGYGLVHTSHFGVDSNYKGVQAPY